MANHESKGTALITGASTGIGATYADRLARRGYDLVLVARDRQRLEDLAHRLRSETGVRTEVIKADLTSKADLAFIEERLRSDHSISILVNNAGTAGASQVIGADLDQIESMIQLNVLALTRLAAAAAPGFAERGKGIIVNLSSVLGIAPEVAGAVYGASKAYVLNFTLSLHQELNPKGVQVQAVLPGMTRTEIWARSGKDIDSLPQNMLMEVEEMVDAALTGLDRKELVTIPSLPDPADWNAFTAARQKLGPNLSHKEAAPRYKVA